MSAQTYNIKILNGSVKVKTLTGSYFSLSGIKDSGTQTGTVASGIIDWSLQNYTKTTAQWNADTTTILLRGQLGIEDTGTSTFKIKIGNGTSLWSALGYSGGSSGASWGTITGTLSAQTDLQTALNAKQPAITTGSSAQYFKGDLSLGTFPTAVSTFSNDAGYITSSSLSPYLLSATAASTYEPIITVSNTGKYWRGDKTFQTLDTLAVPENGNLYFTTARVNTQLATYAGDVTFSGTTSAIGAGKVTNVMLANSTISGVALGSSLSNLSIAAELISGGATTYNGSAVKSIGIQVGSVTNAMLAGAITYSKLSLTNSIVSGDIVSLAWSKITGTPTTLSGYGITDSVALTTGTLAQFATTTSAQLRGVISDELGTGVLLFDGATPTSFILTNATGLPIVAGTTGTLSPLRGGTGIDNSTNTSGSFLRSNGTNGNFAASTLTLPNTLSANSVIFGTGANAAGESANLTFDNTTLSVGALLTNGTVSLRSLVGTATVSAVYLTSAALSASNYALDGNSTATNVNGPTTSLSLRVADVTKVMLTVGAVTLSPGATSTGVISPFKFTSPANTAQTAGTEAIAVDWDLTSTTQHASNTAIPTQRDFLVRGKTHSFASATGTITDAFTFFVSPPAAGPNSVITRAWAAGFDGPVGVNGSLYVGGTLNAGANSTFQNIGSFALQYVAKTTTYSVSSTDYLIDCTSGTFTVTLPTAVSISGRIYVIKNSGAGTITLATTSSQTIDGSTTKTLNTQYSMYRVMSNGANWIVTGII